jgi:hypothetical protein
MVHFLGILTRPRPHEKRARFGQTKRQAYWHSLAAFGRAETRLHLLLTVHQSRFTIHFFYGIIRCEIPELLKRIESPLETYLQNLFSSTVQARPYHLSSLSVAYLKSLDIETDEQAAR